MKLTPRVGGFEVSSRGAHATADFLGGGQRGGGWERALRGIVGGRRIGAVSAAAARPENHPLSSLTQGVVLPDHLNGHNLLETWLQHANRGSF